MPDQHRIKLPNQAKSEKCYFVGYSGEGYRLYNPSTRQIIISRDVIFAENEATTEESENEDGGYIDLPALEPLDESTPSTRQQQAPTHTIDDREDPASDEEFSIE